MTFSAYARVVPENNGQHGVCLLCEPLEDGRFHIRFAWADDCMTCILCEYEARKESVSKEWIEIGSPVNKTKLPFNYEGWVEFDITPDLFGRSYVHIDYFDVKVYDGGYRYTIDLPAFYDAICRGETWETRPSEDSGLWSHPYYRGIKDKERKDRRRHMEERLRARLDSTQQSGEQKQGEASGEEVVPDND